MQVLVWHQAIAWANVDTKLCCYMVSPGHIELTLFSLDQNGWGTAGDNAKNIFWILTDFLLNFIWWGPEVW